MAAVKNVFELTKEELESYLEYLAKVRKATIEDAKRTGNEEQDEGVDQWT